ncbi:unnamed protein product [Cuscuta campestris]|uniref:Retrotransposon gag domain-containing protein n=1 Tax=Cuscuta campestris TaxID=132261 RepID=A0A484MZZ9_9ASTE|nr:unnamed protein product [Cuscuta campestris]
MPHASSTGIDLCNQVRDIGRVFGQVQKVMEDRFDRIDVALSEIQTHLAKSAGGSINEVTHAPKLDMPKSDGSEPVRWLHLVKEYFAYYETPSKDRLQYVTSMLEGAATDWFRWRMNYGLINDWDDFVHKFKIRFDPFHYVFMEKIPEEAQDIVIQAGKGAVAHPTLVVMDKGGSQKLSAEAHTKDDIYSGSDAMGKEGDTPGGEDEANYKLGCTPCAGDVAKGQTLRCVIDPNSQHPLSLVWSRTIMMSHHPLIIKPENQDFKGAARHDIFGCHPYFLHHAPKVKPGRDWSTSEHLLLFIAFSPIQKHEWEPPP